jgi:metallophosphoesterase (TIGR00282 family)
MNVLYIGDVMAEPGMRALEKFLPELKKDLNLDLVIAQAENLSNGRGILRKDFEHLLSLGVDFCTGGNWSLNEPEIYPDLINLESPIIRPANYPTGTPGIGFKYIGTKFGNVLVISLLGGLVGRDSNKEMANPLQVVDAIIESQSQFVKAATIVNFHGDYSSEKLVIGFYLDGKVSAVIGDHWHIPTADACVLDKGTAHITDVGMCGTINSSLGVKTETIIKRWRDGDVVKNEIEMSGPLQFNALFVNIDQRTGLAKSVKQIQKRTD